MPPASEAPSAAAGPALELRGLVKDFAVGLRGVKLRAVDHLDLTVMPGQVYGLLGPNGSGKSTTIKMILGLLESTAGTCRVFGVPSARVEARLDVGYLPESPYFYRHLTGRELVRFYGQMSGMGGASLDVQLDSVLRTVGLTAAADRRVGTYSKGMLQRVGLAQALVNEPDLVFLDEPMSGLDPIGRRDVRSLILALRDRGCTVVFSSHILSDAEALCSRVGIIVGGQLTTSGRLSEILAFEVSGWELVMAGLEPASLETLGTSVRRSTRIGDDRYAIEIPPTEEPERVAAALRAQGGKLVSIIPMRRTLEDYFVQQVTARKAPPAGRVMPEG